MKIGFGCDHAGYELKELLKEEVLRMGNTIDDFGTYSTESADYPDYAHALATSVENIEVEFGIAICGSGNGISMALNKHQGVRAALCWTTEIAELARLHNDANVLSLPARFISTEQAVAIVKVFIDAKFEGGRHQRRVDKIACS
jgi:ribose 5-phosphate isomerase B